MALRPPFFRAFLPSFPQCSVANWTRWTALQMDHEMHLFMGLGRPARGILTQDGIGTSVVSWMVVDSKTIKGNPRLQHRVLHINEVRAIHI